eukprot:gene18021-24433_t
MLAWEGDSVGRAVGKRKKKGGGRQARQRAKKGAAARGGKAAVDQPLKRARAAASGTGRTFKAADGLAERGARAGSCWKLSHCGPQKDRLAPLAHRYQQPATLAAPAGQAPAATVLVAAAPPAIERKDDFLSTMSHELRTPLNGIIGLSESLIGSGNTNLPTKLINDVLDAATLKQGTMVIKHEKVNIKRVVSDVLALCSPLMKKGVRLVNKVDSQIPKIVGDTGRIAQILYNLLGNAAKFTMSGTVTVKAGLSGDNERVFISVADTGEGIPVHKLDRIFIAFEQVDMSTTRRHGGTGLGLHLVKELIKSHNGDIKVQSTFGKGSVFTVWLPVNQSNTGLLDGEMGGHLLDDEDDDEEDEDEMMMMASGAYSKPAGLEGNLMMADDVGGFKLRRPFYLEMHGSCMILSVDDDPINQMVVENLLEPEGYVVQQAMDGIKALHFLDSCDSLPDVILLDVMMPGMSGYEVCAEIRRRFQSTFIPIIMVSAKAGPEHVLQGLEAGGVDYVKKPFHRKELLGRIRSQIRNREVFELEASSRRVNSTFLHLMPVSIVQRLKQGLKVVADEHPYASVLFADLSGFGAGGSTAEIVTVMNRVHCRFEKLLTDHKVSF